MADPPKNWGEGWVDAPVQPAATQPNQPKWGEGWVDAQPSATSDVTPASTGLGGALAQPFKEWWPTQGKTVNEAIDLMAQGNQDWAKRTFWAKPLAALELLGGGMDYALSPVTTTLKTFLGDPFERSTGIPGSSDFVTSAANTAVSFAPTARIIDAVGELAGRAPVAESMLKTFSPTARMTFEEKEAAKTGRDLVRPGAQVTEESIRSMTGHIAQDKEMMDMELGKFRKVVGSLSPLARLDFIDAIESGLSQTDPALQPVANFLRTVLDERKVKIQSLGEGYLDEAIQNYFPHIWKDPTRAAEFFREQSALESSPRPLKGSGAFLKQRTFDTVKAGIEHGLELATDNPLDLVATKLHEMDRFYYGTQMIREMKANGHLRFGRTAPAGWVRLDDPSFKVFVRNDPESGAVPGFTKVGEWYAPEPAARVLNNFLSSGLGATGLSNFGKSIRILNNGVNTFQLTLSAFHFMFVSGDAVISQAVRGMKQAARGEVVRGAKTIATAPGAPLRNFYFGGKLRAAYLNPQSATPLMQRTVQALVEGGGRINMDAYWRAIGTRPVIRSIRDGTYLKDTIAELKGTGLAAPFKLGLKLAQDINAPLMEVWVPRQKLGVFYQMAQDYLRHNPDATTLELRAAMKKSWDSVDNRMGQMVYDNLFWNRLTKDISHILIRSVGWNLGTIREIGGGFVDAAGKLRTLIGRSQKELDLTERMGYVVALPAVHALAGATLTYLMNGHGPTELIDYFYPPTGQTLPNGQKERISIPTYMKDVVSYSEDPVGAVQNKAAPWISSIAEMLQNKDFYGSYLTDPDAGFATNALDYAMFVGGQFLPFSVRGYQRLRQSGSSPAASAMSYLGFQPPPGYITDPEGTERRYEHQLMQERRKKMREQYAASRGAAAAEAATTPVPPGWGEGWK